MLLHVPSKSLIWIYNALSFTDDRVGAPAMTFQYVHGLQNEITNFLADTLRKRRLRGDYVSREILSDPSWDMMLDLYLSERRGREVTVSSLCIASQAPFTTALRWIAKLEGKGLICRLPIPSGRRSSQMLLTDQGRAAMEGWARHAMQPPASAEADLHSRRGWLDSPKAT